MRRRDERQPKKITKIQKFPKIFIIEYRPAVGQDRSVITTRNDLFNRRELFNFGGGEIWRRYFLIHLLVVAPQDVPKLVQIRKTDVSVLV